MRYSIHARLVLLPVGAKVDIGLAATQIPRLHQAVRVDADKPGQLHPVKWKHSPRPVYADLAKLETKKRGLS